MPGHMGMPPIIIAYVTPNKRINTSNDVQLRYWKVWTSGLLINHVDVKVVYKKRLLLDLVDRRCVIKLYDIYILTTIDCIIFYVIISKISVSTVHDFLYFLK